MQFRRNLFGISIPSVRPLRSLCALSLAGVMVTAGAHGTGAQGTDRYAFALQDNEFCEVMDAVGTPVGATPEEFAVEASTPEAGTPVGDLADDIGDISLVDANVEGALCQDVDGDGINEIGIDEDESGTLEENEVLGSELDNDQALTNEFNNGTGAGDDSTGGAPTVDFATYAGDDNSFDADDEGYLSEDVDGDGTNEIGVDEDESGTLDEDEVLGSDENNDEAPTKDEVED